MKSTKTVGPVGRAVRDLFLPWILRGAVKGAGSLAWLFDHHIPWQEPVARAA